MFYTMYLSSVCQRRQWPDPLYEPYRNRNGHYCKVRVNNREYCTEVPYASESLARDGAAQKAYMICRNFSVNDGMFPGQRPGQRSSGGAIQGLPVAIGAGRRRANHRSSGASSSYESSYNPSTDGTSSSSGGNSPRSTESGFDRHHHHQQSQPAAVTPHVPPPPTRRRQPDDAYMCYCRRGQVRAYGRCEYCCRDHGWA